MTNALSSVLCLLPLATLGDASQIKIISICVSLPKVAKAITANVSVTGSSGCANANGKKPKNCLRWVFNFKFGRFDMHAIARHMHARPSLEFKTRPRFCPVSSSCLWVVSPDVLWAVSRAVLGRFWSFSLAILCMILLQTSPM